MNFYMNHGPDFMEPIARGLYLEIAMIEEQHVTQYESLLDPLTSWLEDLVFHKYNEVYMYHSFMEDETEDRRLKQLWELHLNMEIEQLKEACRLLQKYEGKDATEILPPELPLGVKFQSNKAYVRQVLAEQIDLRADGPDYVALDTMPADHRSFQYQTTVNAAGNPSEQVIEQNRAAQGREYRHEPEGEHPIADLREPAPTGANR
jgi:hypothetical protein